MAFVNCKECGYYMFFKPEVVGMIGERLYTSTVRTVV
jgi:hypothetical protein